MVQQLWKTVWMFLEILKIELSYDPVISLLCIYSKDLKAKSQKVICIPMFVAALFKIAKRQKQPIFMKKLMNKQNVVHTYIGILFSLKQEGNAHTCHNMYETCGYQVKLNKADTHTHPTPKTYKYCMTPTYMRYLEWSNSQRQKVEG